MIRYFKGKLPTGFIALFTAKTMNLVSAGLIGVFMPIFLYILFDNDITAVFFWMALASVLTIIIQPIGIKLLNKIGFRRSLQISSLLGVLYYVFYFSLENSDKTHVILYMTAIILSLVAWRLFYWLPYHITFTNLSLAKNRGRQVSSIGAIGQLASATMPLIAGLILLHYSYGVLFLISMLLFGLTIIPYKHVPASREDYKWGYVETWKRLFAKENRSILIPFAGQGAENIAALWIWPIFIFELLEGNYFEVGLLTTLIVGITIIVQLGVGKYLDDSHKGKAFLKYGTTLYSFGWIIKIFVITSFHIFSAGLYHGIIKVFTMTSVSTFMYEISADQGHYIDEYTVLHEMAIHFGRIIMFVAASILLVVVGLSIQWVFVVAALAALTLNLITSSKVSLNSI